MTTTLTYEDRELIQALRAEGLALSEISRLLQLSAAEVEPEKRFFGLERLSGLVSIDWFVMH